MASVRPIARAGRLGMSGPRASPKGRQHQRRLGHRRQLR
jgi:hypothetical protein